MAARCVYAISSEDGITKIGKASSPTRRVASLNTGSPVKLTLKYESPAMDAADLVEKLAHQLLAEKRLNGEWFSVSTEEAISAISAAIAMVERGILPTPPNPKKSKPLDYPDTTAQELKDWQLRLGVTQLAAAKLLAVPAQTYRNWITGRRLAPSYVRVLCFYVEKYGPP